MRGWEKKHSKQSQPTENPYLLWHQFPAVRRDSVCRKRRQTAQNRGGSLEKCQKANKISELGRILTQIAA
jgi:hypothetical protein